MNNRELRSIINMRMRIHIRRLPMSCPACMTDSDTSDKRLFAQQAFEIRQTPLGFRNFQAVLRVDCNTCRVISAIFQLLQSLDQNVLRAAITNISYNSTHKLISLRFGSFPVQIGCLP
ncbi:hypothetical protein D3C78_873100 [compost metagenome]